MGVFWDDEDKIKVNVVGGPRDAEPGPDNRDGKVVFKTAEDADSAKEIWRFPASGGPVRTFNTGATRSAEEGKIDFRGFLSPIALRSYAEYMHRCRVQPDGTYRASDNWQKGIPLDSYMESMWRHFFAVWEGHEAGEVNDDDLAALFFNVQGYMHEWIKEKEKDAVVSGLRRSFGGFRPGT